MAAEQRDQRLEPPRAAATCERRVRRVCMVRGGYDSVRGRTRERPALRRPRRTGRRPGGGQRTIRAVPHGGRTQAGRALHQRGCAPPRRSGGLARRARPRLVHRHRAGGRRRRARRARAASDAGGSSALARSGSCWRRCPAPARSRRCAARREPCRAVRLLVVLAVAAAAIALAVALAGGGGSAARSAAAAPAAAGLRRPDAARARRRAAARAGPDARPQAPRCTSASIRQTFDWSAIERTPGRYDFARYDALMAAAAARARLHGPAGALQPAGLSLAPGPPRPSPRGTFPPRHPRTWATSPPCVVRRYGPDGSFWRAHPDAARATRSAPGRSGTSRACPSTGRPGRDADGVRARCSPRRRRRSARVDPRATIVSAGIPQSRIGVPFARYVEGLYRAGAQRRVRRRSRSIRTRVTPPASLAAIAQARRAHGPPRRPLADLGHRGRLGLRRARRATSPSGRAARRSACAPRCSRWRADRRRAAAARRRLLRPARPPGLPGRPRLLGPAHRALLTLSAGQPKPAFAAFENAARPRAGPLALAQPMKRLTVSHPRGPSPRSPFPRRLRARPTTSPASSPTTCTRQRRRTATSRSPPSRRGRSGIIRQTLDWASVEIAPEQLRLLAASTSSWRRRPATTSASCRCCSTRRRSDRAGPGAKPSTCTPFPKC